MKTFFFWKNDFDNSKLVWKTVTKFFVIPNLKLETSYQQSNACFEKNSFFLPLDAEAGGLFLE